MENFVVTVGRQFGSMGRPIAKKVAEMLDISYYDRDIVEEVSKRMNAPLSLISDKEEGAKFGLGKYAKMLRPGFRHNRPSGQDLLCPGMCATGFCRQGAVYHGWKMQRLSYA